MVLVGIFAACPIALFRYKKRTGDYYPMLAVLLIAAPGALIGGSLMYGITNIKDWYLLTSAASFEEFINNAVLIFGGSVFYGGLIGGMLTAGIAIRVKKYPAELITDVAAPTIALFHTFGRIGCFLAGCCYGIESEYGFPLRHYFPDGSVVEVVRVPVQLYEAGFELILFFVLSFILRKNWLNGRIFALYIILYSVWRFFAEYLRGDLHRGFIFGLYTSQFLSIIMATVATGYIVVRTIRDPMKQTDI